MLQEINNPVWLILAGAVLVNLILTSFIIWKRYVDRKRLGLDDQETNDLRELAMKHKKTLQTHNKNLVELGQILEELVENNRRNIQKIGMVRFNPFAETGGNMSFSLALLDGKNNGIVISSLHSREATRIYTKSIENGQSKSQLTEEEKQAIEKATTD